MGRLVFYGVRRYLSNYLWFFIFFVLAFVFRMGLEKWAGFLVGRCGD